MGTEDNVLRTAYCVSKSTLVMNDRNEARSKRARAAINRHWAWFGVALLLCSACSGSRGTTDDPDSGLDGRDPINMAEYEDFDAASYEDDPPVPSTPVEHDVPESLLEGKVDARPVNRTGPGYRIQIYSTQDKRAADRRAEQAVAWWREQLRAGQLGDLYPYEPSPPPVYQDFRQPYYRVRVGNFATRAEAQAMFRLVERRFPSAFIAPDRVTLER